MIYIDPPYNTGNDSFIYADKFSESKEEYQKRIGDKDEDGYMTKEGMYRKNSKENGQYHSNWLNMMYPRLFLAKNLLRDDGVIFVSIDDNSGFYLDFFSGSGTAAQAIYDLNKEDNGTRKYLCVQLPELCKEGSKAFKAGLKTISEIAKFRIRRLIEKISKEQESAIQFEKSNQDLGFKVLKLANSNLKIWRQQEIKNEEELVQQMKIFVDPVSEEARIENMVYELLLKSGFEINSKIEHINKSFIINTNEMILLLEKVNENIIDEALKRKPVKIIALDKLFKGNDQLKTNTALQMKDAGIDFKTI
ncbi:hypothetical protein ES705_26103 [subsurface metagenome]